MAKEKKKVKYKFKYPHGIYVVSTYEAIVINITHSGVYTLDDSDDDAYWRLLGAPEKFSILNNNDLVPIREVRFEE